MLHLLELRPLALDPFVRTLKKQTLRCAAAHLGGCRPRSQWSNSLVVIEVRSGAVHFVVGDPSKWSGKPVAVSVTGV